jgi:hypothetical protein
LFPDVLLVKAIRPFAPEKVAWAGAVAPTSPTISPAPSRTTRNPNLRMTRPFDCRSAGVTRMCRTLQSGSSLP